MASDDEPLSFDDDELDNLIDENNNNNAPVDRNELVNDEDVDEENIENTVTKRDDDDDPLLANPTSGNLHITYLIKFQTFLPQSLIAQLVLQASSTISLISSFTLYRSTINSELNMVDDMPMTPLRSNLELDQDQQKQVPFTLCLFLTFFQEKVIWGTSIDVEKTILKIKNFIETFPDPRSKQPLFPTVLEQV